MTHGNRTAADLHTPPSMTPWLRDDATTPSPPPDGDTERLTVGEVAALVGISVRTLHHWDAVGLVQPRTRTAGGYRAYTAADVERVHRVLVYRELGFTLTAIGALLDDPDVDEVDRLRRQRDLLRARIARLHEMTVALDRLLESRTDGTRLTTTQQAELFGHGWRQDWADEARDRWGDTPAWDQFAAHLAATTPEERRRAHAEGEALYDDMAAAVRAGTEPDSEQADALVARHRAMVGQVFDCTPARQVCLARLSVEDARFRAALDARAPGLARWFAAAVDASVRRLGIDPEHATWD